MRNKVISLAMILTCFVLQSTILKKLAIGNITPNLLIILCASMGLMRGKTTGLFFGFFSGLLIDIFFGGILGVQAFSYMLIGYISGFCYNIYYDDNIKVPVLLVTGGDLLYSLLIYGMHFLLRGRMDFLYYFRHIMIPEMLYTVIVTVIIYHIFYVINHRFMRLKTKDSDSQWL
ncbi:MAG: rod shape-determining protein MreD [Lachnospiraceae bacterium]